MNKKENIRKNLHENEAYLKNRLGDGVSFDVGSRTFKYGERNVLIYYVTGLCFAEMVMDLFANVNESNDGSIHDFLQHNLPHQQVETTNKFDEAIDRLLSGLLLIFVDGEPECFIIDARQYPGRQPEEPDTEKVIRGARDGFTENIVENTALIRRRIRDENLRNEMVQVGERSKTDVCISYLKDVADPGLVDLVKKELAGIKTDGIPMADRAVEEYIMKQGWNPFPLVRYTERPDVASVHILEGHVMLIVDTSPSAIIIPTTFFHHLQHAEEYRQTPGIGAFLRWVRFIGVFASIFLLPLWYLYVLDPNLLPKEIDFIGPNKDSKIPIILQLLIADYGIDLLRMASIHTPTPLATAMGLIAAVMIGQIAIDVGLFVPEVVLYVAIAAIGTYATPSYELSVANKLVRLFLLLAVLAFKLPGLVIASTLVIVYLVKLKNLNTPYLWPFIPFNLSAFLNVLIRIAEPYKKRRPSILHPQNAKK
nr:spore germination protein [Pueribacillus theae]